MIVNFATCVLNLLYMKTRYNICLLSIGGSSIPYGNIFNDSDKFGNYNLEYLSVFLEKNSITSDLCYYNFFDSDENIEKSLINYDVVIFFIDYLNNQKIASICKHVKENKRNIKLIGFGQFIDKNFKNYYFSCFDYLCLGNPMQSVLNMIQNEFDQNLILNDKYVLCESSNLNKIPNRFYDLNLIPKMDYYKLKNLNIKYKTYTLSTRNNVCFGQCSFCLSEKGKYLYRDAKSIVLEIKSAVRLGVRDFLINDNDFFEIWSDKTNQKRILDIINGLSKIEEKITISCFTKSKTIIQIDDIFLQKFKSVGLYCIFLGIDAGNLDDKKLYQKWSTLDDDRLALKKLKELNIYSRVGFISVNPFSSLKSLKENYDFLISINSTNIYHYGKLRAILFKGTKLYKTACDFHLVKNEHLPIGEYDFENKDVSKIIQFLDKFYLKLDSNKKYYPFIFFKRKYEEAKFLSFETTKKYDKEIHELEEQEFISIKNFFKVIFIENDLLKAQMLMNAFLTDIYCRSNKLNEIAKNLDEIIEKEKYHGISN